MKWCFISLDKNYTTNKKYLGGFWSTYDGWKGEYDEGLSPDYYSTCKYSWKEIKTNFDKPNFPFIYESFDSTLILVPSFIAFILLWKGSLEFFISEKRFIKDYERKCKNGEAE